MSDMSEPEQTDEIQPAKAVRILAHQVGEFFDSIEPAGTLKMEEIGKAQLALVHYKGQFFYTPCHQIEILDRLGDKPVAFVPLMIQDPYVKSAPLLFAGLPVLCLRVSVGDKEEAKQIEDEQREEEERENAQFQSN